MTPEVEAFIAGLQHFPRLLGSGRPMTMYLDAGMVSRENLKAVLRGLNEFSRTMGARGYTFEVASDTLEVEGRILHQIEATPITPETPN